MGDNTKSWNRLSRAKWFAVYLRTAIIIAGFGIFGIHEYLVHH